MSSPTADTASLPLVPPSPVRAWRAAPSGPVVWPASVLFLALSAPGWVAAVGPAATAVAGVVATVGTAILLSIRRPRARLTGLPWTAISLVVFAGASVIWSRWPGATVLTWMLLAATTFQAVALALMLTWHGILRALSFALVGVLTLSLAFELWVALSPPDRLLVEFDRDPGGEVQRSSIWSTGQLFSSGRIEGFLGNANLLGVIALLGVVVFGIRLAAGISRRTPTLLALILAAFLLLRTGSATVFVASVAVTLMLVMILLMRMAQHPRTRTRLYIVFGITAVSAAALVWSARGLVLGFLGRESDLTDRSQIWQAVTERTVTSPLVGNGFTTPWLPWHPAFADWIVMPGGLHIIQAHSVWVDIAFQLGLAGLAGLAAVYGVFLWRSWRLAVGRGHWNRAIDRSSGLIALLPALVATILFVQGLTESSPLLLWGWMLTVLLCTKLAHTPVVRADT